MKIRPLLITAFAILSLYGCTGDNRETSQNDQQPDVNTEKETPVKLLESLVGQWQNENTGQDAQGNAIKTLTFTEEARYIMVSGDQKTDSGAFRMNEQLQNLYLESEVNEQPREYEIQLTADVLTLKPKQPSAGGDNASYTFRRVGQPSIQKPGEN